jgi:hypothetical protein
LIRQLPDSPLRIWKVDAGRPLPTVATTFSGVSRTVVIQHRVQLSAGSRAQAANAMAPLSKMEDAVSPVPAPDAADRQAAPVSPQGTAPGPFVFDDAGRLVGYRPPASVGEGSLAKDTPIPARPFSAVELRQLEELLGVPVIPPPAPSP